MTIFAQSHLDLVRREARLSASRLVRQLRLPWHEHDDVQHDLMADVFARLKHFDPTRGSAGGFVMTVMEHRASLLAWRIRREQKFRAPLSLDDPTPRGRYAVGDLVPESYGYLAFMGQPTDRYGEVERRLDVSRCVGTLDLPDRIFCMELLERSPGEQSEDGRGSRATLYRQLADIRLQLTARGLSRTSLGEGTR